MERDAGARMLVPMVVERTNRGERAQGYAPDVELLARDTGQPLERRRAERELGGHMAEDEGFSIGELAARAGVTQRTIRYYTAEGLLPPPETRGRYARYGQIHLERLRQIAEMKALYMPLSAIRARLEQGGGGEAAGPPIVSAPPRTGGAPGRPIAEAGAPYMLAGQEPARGGEPFRLTPSPLQTGRYEFFPADPPLLDEEGEADRPPARWQRVVLAPGVELHVREPISPLRRAQIDALIAAARDKLRGEE